MVALGIPLALLLGLAADVAASLLRRVRRFQPVFDLWDELRRARSVPEAATLLEILGGGGALLGAGLMTAGAIGAIPSDLATLVLSLLLAVAGAHLAAIEPPTGPAAARARARMVESALVVAGAAAGLTAVFLRWRATDLASVFGVGDVLGFPLAVGPPMAAAGHVVALLAVAAAAGLLVPLATEPSRGRFRRPAAAALLVRLSRWAVAGALVTVLAAFSAGFDPAGGGAAGAYARWIGAAVVGAALVGAVWGGLDRLGPRRRLALAVPAVLGLSAAGVGLILAA